MGRRRVRPFLRKAGAHTYYLVGDFASAGDSEIATENAERGDKGEDADDPFYSRREWESATHGIHLPDNGYDYSQHLRTIGTTPGSVFIPASNATQSQAPSPSLEVQLKAAGEDNDTRQHEAGELNKDTELSHYELEKRAEQAKYEAEVSDLRTRNADLDEVLRLLEEDDGIGIDDPNCLSEAVALNDELLEIEDEFVQLATFGNLPALSEDEASLEAELEKYLHRGERESSEDSAPSRIDAEEAGRRARLLDDQFDRMLEEYASDGSIDTDDDNDDEDHTDDDGDLDHSIDGDDYNDARSDGSQVPALDLIDQLGGDDAVEALMRNCRGLRIDKDSIMHADAFGMDDNEREALRSRYRYESGSDHGWDSDPVLLNLEAEAERRAERERWDCETVLTKNTNIENHPSVIGIPARTGKSSFASAEKSRDVVVEQADEERVLETSEDLVSRFEALRSTARQRGESTEDRKARKASVKEQKRNRRAEKAELKAAFREENTKQAIQASRMGRAKIVKQF